MAGQEGGAEVRSSQQLCLQLAQPPQVPDGEVQEVQGAGGLQVLDGADPVQTLLKEGLGRLHRRGATVRLSQVQTSTMELRGGDAEENPE